jgi:hypothetical protein
MDYSHKRPRDDDSTEPNAKRLRPSEWKRENFNRGCVVDLSRPIFFVDMTRKDFHKSTVRGGQPPKIQRMDKNVKLHANGEPLSVCYRYVLWLYPNIPQQDQASVHSQYSDIESWSNSLGQFFFRRDPFDMLGLPSDLQQMTLAFMTPAEQQASEKTHAIFRIPEERACESVTFNLLDPQLKDNIEKWRIACMLPRLRIKKVVVDGPLAFQEPLTFDNTDNRRNRFEMIAELLSLAENITFKSIEATELSQGYDALSPHRRHLRPKSINVEELRVGASTHEEGVDAEGVDMRFSELAKMFMRGVLRADRWVYGKRDNSIEELRETLAIQKTVFPVVDLPIYIAVDETNEETLVEIQNLGIRNYIVPNRFLEPPNDAFRALIQTAENVIYRPFYDDLMAAN